MNATFEGSTLQTHIGLFSQREAQVVTWVGEGKTDQEIGPICGCTPRTAKAHVLSAMRKLDVHTRAQLVAKAFTKGLMSSLCLLLVLVSCISTDANVMRIRCTARTSARPACTRQIHQGA